MVYHWHAWASDADNNNNSSNALRERPENDRNMGEGTLRVRRWGTMDAAQAPPALAGTYACGGRSNPPGSPTKQATSSTEAQ